MCVCVCSYVWHVAAIIVSYFMSVACNIHCCAHLCSYVCALKCSSAQRYVGAVAGNRGDGGIIWQSVDLHQVCVCVCVVVGANIFVILLDYPVVDGTYSKCWFAVQVSG